MINDSGQGVRIFLADDHPAVLDGLSTVFAGNGHVVCGVAVSIQEALDTIDGCKADIAVVDLSLCGESGLDLIALLKERNIPVLVYSMHEDSSTLQRALDQGAAGYVAKREASDVLLEAVRQVLEGKQYISPRVAANFDPDSSVAGTTWNTGNYTEREKQIIALLGQGEQTIEIAERLGISVRTVETHCSRIIIKLNLDGMKALRKYAISESRLMT